MTFTSIPVFCLNSGRMCQNSPESCVDVVDDTMIDLSWAETGAPDMMAAAATAAMSMRRLNNVILLFSLFRRAVLPRRICGLLRCVVLRRTLRRACLRAHGRGAAARHCRRDAWPDRGHACISRP